MQVQLEAMRLKGCASVLETAPFTQKKKKMVSELFTWLRNKKEKQRWCFSSLSGTGYVVLEQNNMFVCVVVYGGSCVSDRLRLRRK